LVRRHFRQEISEIYVGIFLYLSPRDLHTGNWSAPNVGSYGIW